MGRRHKSLCPRELSRKLHPSLRHIAEPDETYLTNLPLPLPCADGAWGSLGERLFIAMSVHISSVIWKVVMPNAGRKLVAVALADMANDDGSCWPSLRTLSARCNLSEDSVRNHLHALEAIGILKASPRFQDGRQTSNVYCFTADVVTGKALHLEGGRVESTPPLENREGGRKQEGEGGKKQEGGGYEKLPPHESSYRTIIEPSIPQAAPGLVLGFDDQNEDPQQQAYSQAFEQFWNAYPNKKAKGNAFKAFQRAKRQATLDTMLAAIQRQKKSASWTKDNGAYIPHPASWLNGARWLDELDKPTQPKRCPTSCL